MYWFECQQDGPSLVKVQVGGCVAHDKSRHLAVGERYDFGEYTSVDTSLSVTSFLGMNARGSTTGAFRCVRSVV